ncbi:uncharacterized protein LOC134726958 [Mytilus trossulus]|uniref:uncharacterized protein LOC134726958 n=1 Tax=Mytilus trossulus TaxID=6551 RepID=UPI0030078CC7
MYGVLCSETCDCNPDERCDNKVGCISKSTESTVSVNLSNETVTGKQTNTLKDRSSNFEWIIYTLCITGLTILTVMGNILHKKRKQRSLKLKINAEIDLESFQPTPCNGIYSEVDENPLRFDTTELNVALQASLRKSVNFVSQGRQSITTEIEDDETTGYLDVYFDMENDITRKKDEIPHESFPNISENSDVVGNDNKECHKPYTVLLDNRQGDSNACEVIATEHQCSENSSTSEKEATSNVYPDMFKTIQTDKQIQHQANANLLSPKITTVNEPALQEASPSVDKTCNLQDCTNKFVKSEKRIDSVCVIDSNEDKSLDVEKSKTL